MSSQEIKSFIRSLFESQPVLLGSFIGSSLKHEFPELNIKVSYGGVKAFIEEHLANEIEFVRKHGGDDLFTLKHRNSIPTESNRSNHPTDDGQNLWKILSNPENTAQVAVDAENASVEVVTDDEFDNPRFRPISGVTHEIQAQMIRQFISESVEPTERDAFNTIIDRSGENYWRNWTSILNTTGKSRYLNVWIEFRRNFIIDLLGRQLMDLGFDSPKVEQAISNICSRDPKGKSGKQLLETINAPSSDIVESERIVELLRQLPLPILRSIAIDALEELLVAKG